MQHIQSLSCAYIMISLWPFSPKTSSFFSKVLPKLCAPQRLCNTFACDHVCKTSAVAIISAWTGTLMHATFGCFPIAFHSLPQHKLYIVNALLLIYLAIMSDTSWLQRHFCVRNGCSIFMFFGCLFDTNDLFPARSLAYSVYATFFTSSAPYSHLYNKGIILKTYYNSSFLIFLATWLQQSNDTFCNCRQNGVLKLCIAWNMEDIMLPVKDRFYSVKR